MAHGNPVSRDQRVVAFLVLSWIGVFLAAAAKLEHAAKAFHVGNLYFNRKCTGAMVGAHPFAGFNMSFGL